jgi:excisionase family DNA binding protein
MAIDREMKLLTASDVAELCEVDLKTIHNWVDRAHIPHFRTPGRHLRFRALDVVSFLREWGYTVPRKLAGHIIHTVLVIGGRESGAAVSRALGSAVAVHVQPDLMEGLLRVGAEPMSAVVLDAAAAAAMSEQAHAAVAALVRAFPAIPLVLYGQDSLGLADEHPVAVVAEGDTKALRSVLTGEAPAAAAGGAAKAPSGRARSSRRKPSRK